AEIVSARHRFSGRDNAAAGKTRSGIKARPRPRLAYCRTTELHAVMQPERPVVPELHLHRHDTEARPVRRARDFPDCVLGRAESDRLLQCEAAFERSRLSAGPSTDAAAACAGREIGIGLLRRN